MTTAAPAPAFAGAPSAWARPRAGLTVLFAALLVELVFGLGNRLFYAVVLTGGHVPSMEMGAFDLVSELFTMAFMGVSVALAVAAALLSAAPRKAEARGLLLGAAWLFGISAADDALAIGLRFVHREGLFYELLGKSAWLFYAVLDVGAWTLLLVALVRLGRLLGRRLPAAALAVVGALLTYRFGRAFYMAYLRDGSGSSLGDGLSQGISALTHVAFAGLLAWMVQRLRGADFAAAEGVAGGWVTAPRVTDAQRARSLMLRGGLACLVGTAVTAASFSAASGGGTYVVAWGAIIFGAVRFFQGLALSMRSR